MRTEIPMNLKILNIYVFLTFSFFQAGVSESVEGIDTYLIDDIIYGLNKFEVDSIKLCLF